MTEHDPARELVEPSIAPWLSVADGPGAVDYYTAAFGAVERYRLEDDTGRVVVAQLAIGQADFWLQEDPDASPAVGGGSIRMILTVHDPESVFSQAVRAGATQITPSPMATVGASAAWPIRSVTSGRSASHSRTHPAERAAAS